MSYDIHVTDHARHRTRLLLAVPAVAVLAAGGIAFAANQPAAPVRTAAAMKAQLAANPAGIFGTERNPYTIDLRNAPVEANSEAMIKDLQPQVANYWGGVAAFNTDKYNAAPQIAEDDDPLVKVTFQDCQKKVHTPHGLYDGPKMFLDVPMPKNMRVTNGTDKAVTILKPSTDQMWEFWVVENVDTQDRTGFSACWGGRIDNISKGNAQHVDFFGSSASGLAQPGSMIGIEEAKAGKINHTMGLGIMRTRAGTNWWPAVRNDGNTPGDNIIPEGARLRLKPDADLSKLTPTARAIGEAAKVYGFTVVDTAGAVSIMGEDAPTADGKGSRWDTEVFNGIPNYKQLEGFPWDKLEVVQAGYGKDGQAKSPAPDASDTHSALPVPTGEPTSSRPAPTTTEAPTSNTPAPTTEIGPNPTTPITATGTPTATATAEPTTPITTTANPTPTATAPIAVGEPTPGVPVDGDFMHSKGRRLRLDCVLLPAQHGQPQRMECSIRGRRPANITLTLGSDTQTPPVQPRS